MRSEQNRSIISRPLATALIVMASGLACSAATAAPVSKSKAKSDTLQGLQVRGQKAAAVKIDDLRGSSSFGSVTDSRGIETKYLFRNQLIVRSDNWDAVASRLGSIPGVVLGDEIGNHGDFRVISTPDVATAFKVQRALQGAEGVISAEVDSSIADTNRLDRLFAASSKRRAHAPLTGSYSHAQDAKGVIAIDDGSATQSIPSAQWHFVNDGSAAPVPGDWADHDNNIEESIYSGELLSGAGVNIGISSFINNVHLDTNHTKLVNPGVRTGGYRHDLSMIADLILTPDDPYLTRYAGVLAAERSALSPTPVASEIQGVAPGAGVATMFRGPTPLYESQAYEWMSQSIGIKVHQLTTEYDTPGAGYNESQLSEFVTDSFRNSYVFGRRGRGTINIFGTGVGFNLLPDPYSGAFGGSSHPWDGVATFQNSVAVSVTNGYGGVGPLYVGGQTHQYPIVNDRNALIINSVSEDGNVDSLGAVGPAIFASVYAGSTNEFWSTNQAVSGRGLLTIGENETASILMPSPAVGADIGSAGMSGSVVAGGIVALMLEANPTLLVRDIQHIFFQSIQESTKAPDKKWPHFEATRVYYFPDAPPTSPAFLRRSFWQANNGFYNNPNAVPPVINQTVRHSDQYGFGIVDAELAIQKAKTWSRLPQLVLLDSGLQGEVGQDGIGDPEDPRVPVAIADAIFGTPSVAPDISGIDGAVNMIPNTDLQQIRFCVRDNIRIESIVVELTISGEGSNDLYMTLTSPTGSRTILSLPTTLNTLSGQSTDALDDDELDLPFSSGDVNGTTYAYYQHPFLTYKHWGELSGGSWALDFADYGPDEANPVGVEPGDPAAMPPEPGGDMVVSLGEIGIPGSTVRGEKVVEAFRIKIYGTETGSDIFFGCDPAATSCPGDLNGDGFIDTADLILFLDWFQTGDVRSDVNQDGDLDFADLIFYRGIFVPGMCSTNQNGFVGGRPRPGANNPSDTNPPIRPI